MLRLNEPALHVLLALGVETKHGYAIMQDIAERSGGEIRILPGTLYTTIARMVEAKLVEECAPPRDTAADDARRRYYRVTAAGRAAARAEMRRLTTLVRLGKVFQA
jgi:DNA-binding PadR family transcriptional regulator